MSKERLHYIDIAKGLLIIFLCFHHFPQALATCGMSMEYKEMLHDSWSIYYMVFFMQTFFLITGYCTNWQKEFKPFLISNVKMLLIPAVCYVFLTQLFLSLFFGGWKRFYLIFFHGFGFWFLWSLFTCKIAYWFILRLPYNRVCILGLMILVCFTGVYSSSHIWLIPNFAYWKQSMVIFIFLFIGHQMKLHAASLENKHYILSGGLFILSLIILKNADIHIPFMTAFIDVGIIEVPLYLFLAITGSLALLGISKWIKSNYFLEDLGKLSLVIYGVHSVVLKILVKYANQSSVLNMETSFNAWIFYFITCVLTLLISYVIAKIISKCECLKLLTGKW